MEVTSALQPGRFTPQGKNPAYKLKRRVDGPQSWSGQLRERGGGGYSLAGNEPRILGCPTCSLVIIASAQQPWRHCATRGSFPLSPWAAHCLWWYWLPHSQKTQRTVYYDYEISPMRYVLFYWKHVLWGNRISHSGIRNYSKSAAFALSFRLKSCFLKVTVFNR